MGPATLLRRWKLEGIRRGTAPLKALMSVPLIHTSAPATGRCYLNVFSIFSKEEREKERQRLNDEMNRGYFDDIKDLKKHGGKIAVASPNVSSKVAAPKFPTLVIRSATGDTSIIPSQNLVSENNTPRVTLVCIAFRANAQNMVESWTVPFFDAFKLTPGVQLFQVSWIDSWFLSLRPVQGLLLQFMRNEEIGDDNQLLKRQIMYTFGDSYDTRKMLNIKNRLSGYVFLLDEEGYIRWQASGMATLEELSFMVSCTSRLLKECQ